MSKITRIVAGGLLAAGIVGTASAQNTSIRITHGDAFFDVGTSTGSAVAALPTANQGANPAANYQITAAPVARNSFSGWWYYRVNTVGGVPTGEVRERNFANAATKVLTGTNRVDYGFPTMVGSSNSTAPATIPGLSGSLMWNLTDTGPNSANVQSRARINNATGGDVAIDVFFCYDNDLAGTFPGDTVAALSLAGGDRTWTITDPGVAPLNWTMHVRGYGAHGAGAGGFSAINTQLTDTAIDNFIPDLNAGGLAAADNAEVMQWRLTIPNGSSSDLYAAMAVGNGGVNPVIIPEPASLVLLGLAGLMLRRR